MSKGAVLIEYPVCTTGGAIVTKKRLVALVVSGTTVWQMRFRLKGARSRIIVRARAEAFAQTHDYVIVASMGSVRRRRPARAR